MSILDKILARKREEVAIARRSLPTAELERHAAAAAPVPDFAAALRDPASLAPRLIAEVKQRSPSKGLLSADFDPLLLAQAYAGNGAAAISVLTDEHYFGGSLRHLRAVATLELGKPLLRKDFIFDRYQLLQARAAGASAALLIVAMLPPGQLAHLLAAAAELRLAALVEVHTRTELDAALSAHADIIGVNNRDLHTFETNLHVTATLRPHIPATVIMVAESGIHTLEDVQRLAQLRVDAMLIGESLVTAVDTAARVREFTQRTNDQQPTTTAAFVSRPSPPVAKRESSVNIKICGVTSPEEALLAAELRATHIGLNFYPRSPRFLSFERARAIVRALRALPTPPMLVGVFVNENAAAIRRAMATHKLDLAQLSGDEPDALLLQLGDCAYKTYRLGTNPRPTFRPSDSDQRAPAFLLDAHVPGQYGGTGHTCDWTAAAGIAHRYDVLLAGGLTPENVAQAITRVKPWGVDVASGVERAPGIKDARRMMAFVSIALAIAERKSSELQKPILGRR